MKQYHDLLKNILEHGAAKADRTGTGTLSVFGAMMRFDLSEGFPLVTTKKIHLKSVIHELLWFIKGETNTAYLKKNGVKIWDEWADEEGELGPIYGKQWRCWPKSNGECIDQLAKVINDIKSNPDSRRLIVNSWNVGELPAMKLAPCHLLFQFYVNDGKLSCTMYQRSADMFLGVPFNIASYALLTSMVAQECGLVAGEFIHMLGDAHIYTNHLDAVEEQLTRSPYTLPQLNLRPHVKRVVDFKYDDIEVVDYQHHPSIKAPVAV